MKYCSLSSSRTRAFLFLLLAAACLLLPKHALAQGCSYSVSPKTFMATAGSTSVSISVTTQPGCAWTPISTVSWLSAGSATVSAGSGQFTVSVQANLTSQARSTLVIIGNTTFSVEQEAGGPCAPTVSNSPPAIPGSGGNASVAISVAAGCTWSASVTPTSAWIALSSPSGVGNGNLQITAGANTDSAPRLATLVIQTNSGTARRSIVQLGAPCQYSVSPSSVSLPSTGGDFDLNVQTGPTCGWFVSIVGARVEVLDGSSTRTGSGTARLHMLPNETTEPRTSVISIAGVTVNVTQAGAVPAPKLISSSGGFSITVSEGSGQASAWRGWQLSSTADSIAFAVVGDLPPWLRVTPDKNQTPTVVEIQTDATGLKRGFYQHEVKIRPNNASISPVTFLVSLRVEANVRLRFAPRALTFRVEQSGPSPSQQAVLLLPPEGNPNVQPDITPGRPFAAQRNDSESFWRILFEMTSNQVPASAAVGLHRLICPDFGCRTDVVEYAVESMPAPGPGPRIASGGVVNGASFLQGASVGAWMSIFGKNLATTTRLWNLSDFQGKTMPRSLDGVSVTVGGVPAPIQFISPGQINIQVPDNVRQPRTSPWLDLVVTTPAGSDTTKTYIFREAPGLFAFANGTDIAAVHPDGVIVAAPDTFPGNTSRPALPGDIVSLYGTGFGPTDPPVPSGEIYAGAAPLVSLQGLTIHIGRKPAEVKFAGLSAAGLHQFNVVVPPNLTPGRHRVEMAVFNSPVITNATILVGER